MSASAHKPVLEYASPQPRPSHRAILRLSCWIVLAVAIVAGNIAIIFRPSIFVSQWLLVLWPATGLVVLGITALLATTPPDAIRLSGRLSALIIIAVAALLHALGVAAAYPELSMDMMRYRSDGEIWAEGGSPWSNAPGEFWRDSVGYSMRRENGDTPPFEELRTIYPPVAQVAFGFVKLMDGATPGAWYFPTRASLIAVDRVRTYGGWIEAFLFRSGASLAALASTLSLLSTVRLLGRSPWYVALFAWHPLTIVETSAQGHIDAFGVLFVVLALGAAQRKRFVIAAILLAAAAGVKPHVAMLGAVLISIALSLEFPSVRLGFSQGARKGLALVVALAFVFGLVAVYSPIVFFPANLAGWRETAAVYAMSWEANGSIYELITAPFRVGDGRSLEAAKLGARVLGGVGAAVTLYLVIRNRLPLADAAYWLFLTPLLVAPVVYPWYLLWGLAVVPMLQCSRGWTMLMWAATSGLSYQLLREPAWRLPYVFAVAEYVPVYAALVIELGLIRHGLRPAADDLLTKVYHQLALQRSR